MTYSLSLTAIAKREIHETFLWYEGKQDFLGMKFKEHISSLMEGIQKNPGIYQVRYSDVRIAFMRKFPYGVHYRFDETQIVIIGVYHTSRDSKNWNKKFQS